MLLGRIELIQIRLPLLFPFETSLGRTTERNIILVRVEDANGVEGWGECVADDLPHYSEEWTGSAWPALEEVLAPLVIGKEFDDVNALFGHIRGNRMAKAAIESACWDLEARQRSIPLWQLLGGTQREIPCGVSIGLQPSVDALLKKIEHELAAGYQRIKIKIKPGQDVDLIAAVRKRFPDVALMADANSAYRIADAPLLAALDEFHLMMIEQPLGHEDIAGHAHLQKRIGTPICLDESIRSAADAEHAIDLGACHIINIKMGRVGGQAEARAIERVCRERGVAVWCGGMLEAGIGRAHNIALSTLPGFTLPGDVSASARYWEEDIIDPPVTVTPRGTIVPPGGAGIGFEVQRDRIEKVTVRRSAFSRAPAREKVAEGRMRGPSPGAEPVLSEAEGRHPLPQAGEGTAALEIRPIRGMNEFLAVEDLQREVWKVVDREIVPALHLIPTVAVGGILIGAFDRDRMVGFVYGFPGFEERRPIIHSDMLAVLDEYRSHGLGTRLKLAQRDAALERGIDRITWTFDPLQARNAHLNFAHLGVTADRYLRDFYGETTSPLHRGIGTDRLWVTWNLKASPSESAEDERIAIPPDIAALPLDEARKWREKTRAGFEAAFARGLIVTAFDRATSSYLLSRSDAGSISPAARR